jgi:putative membrane-bound dehydrogenase-like protein
VAVEPDVVFFEDTTGDGIADVKRVVFTGFGDHRDRLDSQMFLNSLAWGLDNRIHGAKGHGGVIVPLASREREPIDLRGRDFSFDPRTHDMRAESGGGKQGLSFDDYGRKFVSTQSSPFLMLMYEDRYAGRNPHYAPPRALADIALDAGESVDRQPVRRISAEDPWRRIRNRWRADGIFAGPPPQPAGYITAATGVTVYRGDAWPAAYRGDVFVGASANNLVHHRRLVSEGVGFRARRVQEEADAEFLASTDIWFRPVAFANGPDGALYIADLYREIIDFSDGVPEAVKRVKDLNRGNDRGRIYRVVPETFLPRRIPDLRRFTTRELVQTLEHPNAWHRETASRLLYERQDKAAIPELVRLFETSSSPLGRVHALYALDGLAGLAAEYLLRALEDPAAGVREHAVRLAERFAGEPRAWEVLWPRLQARADDDDVRVRYQLAFTLGDVRQPERLQVLGDLLARDLEEPWMHVAVLSSLAEGSGEVLRQFAAGPHADSPAGRRWLREMLRTIGSRNRGRELLEALELLTATRQPDVALALLAPFAEGLQRAEVPLDLFGSRLRPLLDHAVAAMRDRKAAEGLRVQAIELIGLTAATPQTREALLALVASDQPRPVQSAAIAALARRDEPELARELIARWPRFTPALKREVLPLLLARPERIFPMLEAFNSGAILKNELTPTQVAFLRAHRNPEVRRAAAAAFAAPSHADRQAVIDHYRPALDLAGSAARGQLTYAARCASCHSDGRSGYPLGPSVESMRSSSREEILTHVLDPNRTVDGRYRVHLVETTDGKTVMGIIESETDTTVTLRQPFGAGDTRQRSRIARIEALDQSIMPDGLEEGLSLTDMADLLAFVTGGQ